MLMAIIVTDAGLVKETIIKFDEDITEEQVQTLNYIFNNKLKGKPLDTINQPMEEYIFKEMNYSINVIKPIAYGFRTFRRFKSRIMISKGLLKIKKIANA